MATHESSVNKFTRYRLPSVLNTEASSVPMMEPVKANSLTAARRPVLKAPATAIFIIPGDPDVVSGMVKAVYDDLQFTHGAANMEFREDLPYIRFKARTEEDVLALVRAAQVLATKQLAGVPTELDFIFVEPPAGYMAANFQIVVETPKDAKHPQILVEDTSEATDLLAESPSDTYEQEFSECLYEALGKSSALHGSLTIRIYLGQYLFTKYKKGKYTLSQFESMVRHPRAEGHLSTRLGKTPSADEPSVEAAMRLIQGDGSPCVPIDNQTATTADVVPTYVFEIWHDGDRYETELDRIGNKQRSAKGPQEFALDRTTVVSQDAQTPRFEALSIGIGRKLDWKITAILDDKKAQTSPAVKQYLKKGRAVMQGSSQDFHSYPAIRLPENPSLATKFKSIAIKSIYQFNWMNTGYMVQVTISRRWETIRDMNRKPPSETDFDITINADNWKQDAHAQKVGETVGKGWESDLGGLLCDDKAGAAAGGELRRARELMKTIQDIRGFFEGLYRI